MVKSFLPRHVHLPTSRDPKADWMGAASRQGEGQLSRSPAQPKSLNFCSLSPVSLPSHPVLLLSIFQLPGMLGTLLLRSRLVELGHKVSRAQGFAHRC